MEHYERENADSTATKPPQVGVVVCFCANPENFDDGKINGN